MIFPAIRPVRQRFARLTSFLRKHALAVLLTAGLPVVFTGCGTLNVDDAAKSPALKGDAIAVFVLRTENHFKPWNPEAEILYVDEGVGNKGDESRYLFDFPQLESKNSFAEYVVSMRLRPGRYTLDELDTSVSIPFVGAGRGTIPLQETFNVAAGHYYYLGRISAHLREITSKSDLPAGGVIPIIPQKVSGCADGTFDVAIEDKYAEDASLVARSYPAMRGVKLEKMLLPPWNRPTRR